MANNDLSKLFNQINKFPQEVLLKVIAFLFPELSSRESECLYWISMGLNKSDISDLMSITEETVKSYTKECRKKLKVDSSVALRSIYHSRISTFMLKAAMLNLQADNK